MCESKLAMKVFKAKVFLYEHTHKRRSRGAVDVTESLSFTAFLDPPFDTFLIRI